MDQRNAGLECRSSERRPAFRKRIPTHYSLSMHFPRAPAGGAEADFSPFVNNWFSVLRKGQNYIWDVLNYLKCIFTQVPCESQHLRKGFYGVRKERSRKTNNPWYMHTGSRQMTCSFPHVREITPKIRPPRFILPGERTHLSYKNEFIGRKSWKKFAVFAGILTFASYKRTKQTIWSSITLISFGGGAWGIIISQVWELVCKSWEDKTRLRDKLRPAALAAGLSFLMASGTKTNE